MKNKIKLTLRKTRKSIIEYIATNRLFLTYVLISTLGLLLVRNFTIDNMFSFETFIVDLAIVLIIGSFGYLVKPKNQYRYFFIVLITYLLVLSIFYGA